MANQTVTVKGYVTLFERLFQQDPRVRSFQLGDVFNADQGNLDYTAVILQPVEIRPLLGSGGIVMNEYRVSLFCLGLRLKDNSNTVDVLSETANILTDSITKLLQADEYYNLQIQLNDDIRLEHLYVKGNDLALGHAMTFSFQAPYLLDNCDFDFGAISDNSGTCAAVLVQNSDGSYSVSIESGGSLILEDVTVVNGLQQETFPYSGTMYTNFTGSSVQADVNDSVGTSLTSTTIPSGGIFEFVVQDSLLQNTSGSFSVSLPATSGYTIQDITVQNTITGQENSFPYSGSVYGAFSGSPVVSNVFAQGGALIVSASTDAGGVFETTLTDLTISNNSPLQLFTVSKALNNYNLPDIEWNNSDGADISSYLPVFYEELLIAPDITISNINGGGQSFTVPLSGSIGLDFSSVTSTSNIKVQNSVSSTIYSAPNFPCGSAATITVGDSLIRVYADDTRSVLLSGFSSPATDIVLVDIPYFNIINSDGQSASTVSWSGNVYTSFSGGGVTLSGISYQRIYPSSNGVSYVQGDTHYHITAGTYSFTKPDNPASFAEIDYTATEADIRGTYHGANGDGTDLIVPTYLKENNAFGNKYRFTDSIGNHSDASTSSLWDHVNFNSHSYTGAIADYIIDHLTGLGHYSDPVTDGTQYNMNTTVPADGKTWGDWCLFVNTGCTVAGFSDWRLFSPEEATSGFQVDRNSVDGEDWALNISSAVRCYTILSTSINATDFQSVWDSTNSTYLLGSQSKAGSSGFNHRISYPFVLRNHY